MNLIDLHWMYVIGFAGQSLFGARMIVQWLNSEKEGKVVSPVLYWQLSLVASSIVLIYGILRNDVIIVLGQFLSYYIYVRNLQLKNRWTTMPPAGRILLLILPVGILVGFLATTHGKLDLILSKTDFAQPIFVLGAVGQLILNFRFFYQWYYSEKIKMSVLPLGFWIISLTASLFIFTYGVYRIDPVLLVSQSLGSVAYVRNIILHFHRSSVSQKEDTH